MSTPRCCLRLLMILCQVMVALMNGSHHEECLCCWRELVLLDGLGDVALDEKTYNLALSSAVKAGRWEEMESIFDMMQVGEVCLRLVVWCGRVVVFDAAATAAVFFAAVCAQGMAQPLPALLATSWSFFQEASQRSRCPLTRSTLYSHA